MVTKCTKTFSFLLCCYLVQLGCCASQWCYTTDPSPLREYASYTTYLDSQGQPDAVDEGIAGCEVKHFYYVNRHGTRHPSDSTSDDQWTLMPLLRDRILENHAEGKGSLCTEDLNRLQSWLPRTREEDRNALAETGWQELRDIAERFEVRYPSLLSLNYSDTTRDHFYFRHTDEHRTQDTSRAFSEGLFGYWEGVNMLEVPEDEDILLRFYKNCPRYTEEVENQPNVEKELFLAGPEVAEMIRRMEVRLGFEQGELDFDLAFEMYDNCRLDFGIYHDSPWCSTVTAEDLEVINYSEDLEYYWEKVYGHEINYEMSCPIIVDLMEHFDAAILSGLSGTSLHFAHGSTCFPLTARMGLYNDTVPPLASNFDDRHNRLWDTTYRLPMATNFA